jgi:hypothetical protein
MRRRTFLEAALSAFAFALSALPMKVQSTLAAICSKPKSRPSLIKLPPLPKWNKLTDDIDSVDFARRSEEYERSLLPPHIVFPRSGQIWEATRDCEIYGMGATRPGSLTKVRLQEGDRVRISELQHPKPLTVRFRPIKTPESNALELFLTTACTLPLPGEKISYFTELFRLVGETES